MFKLFTKKAEINYSELRKQGAIIIDVRSKQEFESGHSKGTINVPLDTLSANVSSIGDKKVPVITCCMSGGRSAVATKVLKDAGYENVYDGGGWKALQSKLQ